MRRSEKGRSMVEMLGVLAIIGVLSVGGIYGYTVAMAKYKANEVAQSASMLATLAIAKASTSTAQVSDYGLDDAGISTTTTVQGCTPVAVAPAGGASVTVTISCPDSGIKKALEGIVSNGNGITYTVTS